MRIEEIPAKPKEQKIIRVAAYAPASRPIRTPPSTR